MSRSGFYYVPRSPDSEELAIEIKVIHCFDENNECCGRRRIKRELEKDGICISEKKIARILRKYERVAKSGRAGKSKKRKDKPTEEQYTEENLIFYKFSVTVPNALWCSDITELKCKGSKIYLCGIIDVATRRIVGWCVSRTQTQKIVQDAFMMAVGRNPNRPEGAIFHSDRGCQYTAKRTKEMVEKHGFRKSMSRPGTPSDNQPIESFWKTLKQELQDISQLKFKEASSVITSYIEMYYNSKRLHSGINYMSPNQKFTDQIVQ
ncbi:MAG: IS3 family transposase [Clostridia bacterium]|nr:IS3 family transposase [Clostridia bacterium]